MDGTRQGNRMIGESGESPKEVHRFAEVSS
jgi:hypothetical protein